MVYTGRLPEFPGHTVDVLLVDELEDEVDVLDELVLELVLELDEVELVVDVEYGSVVVVVTVGEDEDSDTQ
jgi:hypothetical protein